MAHRIDGHTNTYRAPSSEVAFYGVLAALALVVGYLEALFPLPIPVPGIKLGLGNIVVLFTLLGFGWRPGLAVMLLKVIASSLLFGNPYILIYSIAGGVVSYVAMCIALRTHVMSIEGISMVGGVFHMLGQLLVVAILIAPRIAATYAPVLLIAGLITGFINGWLVRLIVRSVGRSSYFTNKRKIRAMQIKLSEGN